MTQSRRTHPTALDRRETNVFEPWNSCRHVHLLSICSTSVTFARLLGVQTELEVRVQQVEGLVTAIVQRGDLVYIETGPNYIEYAMEPRQQDEMVETWPCSDRDLASRMMCWALSKKSLAQVSKDVGEKMKSMVEASNQSILSQLQRGSNADASLFTRYAVSGTDPEYVPIPTCLRSCCAKTGTDAGFRHTSGLDVGFADASGTARAHGALPAYALARRCPVLT
eukprot:3589712-Rhodomonas_salina.1